MGCALSAPGDAGAGYRSLSLWHDTAPDDWVPRPAPGDLNADVAVVGAGFTGLLTAYYLLRADPTLRVVVLEQETAAFGASGRNGGWCSALFPSPPSTSSPACPARTATARSPSTRRDALSVDEVGRVCAAEGIDAHFHKGGTVSLARSRAQLRSARAEVADARAWGRGDDEVALLDRRTPYADWPRPGPSAAPTPPTAP